MPPNRLKPPPALWAALSACDESIMSSYGYIRLGRDEYLLKQSSWVLRHTLFKGLLKLEVGCVATYVCTYQYDKIAGC